MNYTKRCTKCQGEFPATLEFFHKQKTGKYGLVSRCKQCIKVYNEQNNDRKAEYNRRYRKENKEQISAYRKANKEEILKKRKLYYQENKEREAKRNKQYNEANKEKRKEKRKEYLKKNKNLSRKWAAKRRASKLNQTPNYTNPSLVDKIYENCPEGYHVDHMTPLACGGLHHESNLCYLPQAITASKGSKSIQEFGEEEFNKHVIYWQDILQYFSQ